MRPLLIAIIIIISISCRQTEKKQKVILPPDFDKEFSLDTSVKFQNVRHVAYGYSLSYPLSFVEVQDTVGQVDSLILYSKDRFAKIKFFVEGDIRKSKDQKDESEKNFFSQYFDSLTNSKHSLTRDAKVSKSSYTFKSYEYGNPAKFTLLGEKETSEFIMQTELSEVPISGDLTLKSFVMQYPKTEKSYFRPIALEIAKTFGQ
ncbi:hypothetical protein [Terrimonas alba]|uniref:hypothetical protein n=1 Tax=Terrimonas alba TaxID=3349636 RepID=UPI0035F35E83